MNVSVLFITQSCQNGWHRYFRLKLMCYKLPFIQVLRAHGIVFDCYGVWDFYLVHKLTYFRKIFTIPLLYLLHSPDTFHNQQSNHPEIISPSILGMCHYAARHV